MENGIKLSPVGRTENLKIEPHLKTNIELCEKDCQSESYGKDCKI